MKLILLADSNVGLETLKFLINQFPSDIGLVVTIDQNEIYFYAKNAGLEVVEYNYFKKNVTNYNLFYSLGILAWWPKIISSQIISLPKNGFINFHPSFLPFNRGKNYNFWALVEQCPFGVSLHFVEEGIDTGDIVAQKKLDYDWLDTGETLYFKAQKEMLDLFITEYPNIRVLNINRKKQLLERGSFHKSNELENASKIELDDKYSARELLNLLRAKTFQGYPGCFFIEDNQRYEINILIKKVGDSESN